MNNIYQNSKEFLKIKSLKFIKNSKELLIETPLEVAIGAGLGFIIASSVAYHYESVRAMKIPLGFSEFSQIEYEAKAKGEELGPLNHYLPVTNDAVMKVFEAWNIAHKKTFFTGDYVHNFAKELDIITEVTLKTHKRDLSDLLKELPTLSQKALDSLKDFRKVRDNITPVNGYFAASWDDSHIDNYHTEIYTETETYSDSEGKTQTREVTKTREVYDDTTHTYTYHKVQGELASKHLNKLLSENIDLKFKEKMRTAKITNAEGEYAAEISREHVNGKNRLSTYDFHNISNTWKTGSTLESNLPTIYSMWAAINQDADKWRTAKYKARSDTITTYIENGPHPDPIEFQVAETALSHGKQLESNISEIIQGIEYVRNQTPVLQSKIKDIIAIELDKKEGDSEEVANQIMSISKAMYTQNFKNGFDIDRFRWGRVIGLVFMGGIVGAGLGLVLDKADNKFDLYKRNNS